MAEIIQHYYLSAFPPYDSPFLPTADGYYSQLPDMRLSSPQSKRIPIPPSESNPIPQKVSTRTKARVNKANRPLTKAEQQQNHVNSETRRRHKLEHAWKGLADLIPTVNHNDRKEVKNTAVISQKGYKFSIEQLAKRKNLVEALEVKGVDVQQCLGINRDERAPVELPPELTKAKKTKAEKARTG
ncbi:MAG: hypothetical protein Q9218_000785 [Villophora microphyllina]